nr:zinc finger protein 436-like isoform X1 [Dermacentor andersoni]
MAEERSNEYTPLDLNMKDKATRSTSRDGTQDASTTLGAFTTISDDAWPYQWITQCRPITDGTYNLDGVTENASTSSLLLGPSNSIDHGRPSTSRPGIEQATAILEDGARFPETTSVVGQSNTQYHTVDGTSSVSGHTANTEDGSTGFRLPVYSSSSGVDVTVASTSYVDMDEASDILGNEARNAIGSGGRELQELCDVSGNVSSGRDASHGYPNEHTGDRAHMYKARDQSSVKEPKFVERCRNRTAENHKCESCGKLYHRAHHLVRHYRTHTNEKPYKCEICDKSFRRSDHLSIHKRNHIDEKPYKCKICGKSVSNAWTLRAHQLTHSEERPHVCHSCTTTFKTKGNLNRHLKLNCRYGAFVCDIGNLFCMDNLGLSHHRQTMHGDNTLYECMRCGFSFAEKETLGEHLCQSYKCYLCGNSFGDVIQLITHVITHSGEQP